MSNATRTHRTAFVGLRMPLDLLVKIDQAEGDRTSVIVSALRERFPADQSLQAEDCVTTEGLGKAGGK